MGKCSRVYADHLNNTVKVLNMVLIFKSTQQNLDCFWDFLNINVKNLSNYGINPGQIKSEKTK